MEQTRGGTVGEQVTGYHSSTGTRRRRQHLALCRLLDQTSRSIDFGPARVWLRRRDLETQMAAQCVYVQVRTC